MMAVISNGPQSPLATGTPLWWIVMGGAVLAASAVAMLRIVREGERLVVFRFGRVITVKGPGLAVVLPGVDRGVRVALGPTHLDFLGLDAVTRDGVAVRVNGAALACVRDSVAYVRNRASNSAGITVVEAEIREYVAERDLVELCQPDEMGRRELAARISCRTCAWGVEVTLVDFSRVEVRLKPDLIRWAEGFAARARHAGRTA